MKIELPEHTRIELDYIYGNDEKAWSQAIEHIIGEIAQSVWFMREHNTHEDIAPCEHRWIKKQQDGTYHCAACDKILKIEDEIPY